MKCLVVLGLGCMGQSAGLQQLVWLPKEQERVCMRKRVKGWEGEGLFVST